MHDIAWARESRPLALIMGLAFSVCGSGGDGGTLYKYAIEPPQPEEPTTPEGRLASIERTMALTESGIAPVRDVVRIMASYRRKVEVQEKACDIIYEWMCGRHSRRASNARAHDLLKCSVPMPTTATDTECANVDADADETTSPPTVSDISGLDCILGAFRLLPPSSPAMYRLLAILGKFYDASADEDTLNQLFASSPPGTFGTLSP